MSTNRVENGRPSTGSMPITESVYGKKGRARSKPKRPSNAPRRHEFRVDIPADVRQKLAALQGRLERNASKPKRSPRSRGWWRLYRVSPPGAKKARTSWPKIAKRRQARGKKGGWLRQQLRGTLGYR